MKKIVSILAGTIMPFLLTAQNRTDSTFNFRVDMANANKHAKLYLLYQVDGKRITDSAVQVNGRFNFRGKAVRPLYSTLIVDTSGIGLSRLLAKKMKEIDMLRFYISPGDMVIKTNGLVADGRFFNSPINTDNQRLDSLLKNINTQRYELSTRLMATADAKVAHVLAQQLDSLNLVKKPFLKQFVIENPKSYVALVALEEYAGSFPDMAVAMPLFNSLSSDIRNTVPGKEYYIFLTSFKNLAVGNKAPGFTQVDTTGKPISLSAFRGKYVLIDFWASWCGPCRQENPALVSIYQDFKDRNFTILGVSFDGADGKSAWLNAIKTDHLTWTHVSDLKHWDNQVGKLYGIRAIPYNFLIGPEGDIIARGLDNTGLRKLLEEKLPK